MVDLYAGIGYFTLPFLLGGAGHVHACEINPDSVEALRRNLADNGVADRCTVYLGDNAVTSQKLHSMWARIPPDQHLTATRADRVSLGLLPTADLGVPLAVRSRTFPAADRVAGQRSEGQWGDAPRPRERQGHSRGRRAVGRSSGC